MKRGKGKKHAILRIFNSWQSAVETRNLSHTFCILIKDEDYIHQY